jgi:hypothetical protein
MSTWSRLWQKSKYLPAWMPLQQAIAAAFRAAPAR